jgi:hypothetical protein
MEAVTCFLDERAFTAPDKDDPDRFVLIGVSRRLRVLFVVSAEVGERRRSRSRQRSVDMYACQCQNVCMPKGSNLVRRSFFVDERELRRAKKVLGASSDAEAVRLSLEQVAEMAAFWTTLDKAAGTLRVDDFGAI